MDHLKNFQHLKIQLDVIRKATKDFSKENRIGAGGFGGVYKGKIPDLDGHDMVALKRLSRRLGQGDTEFWKEVMLLSQYKHENIVSLIGFCDDSGERILVYPYAPNGSLDCHLNNDNLGWIGRLKICIGAAQGLVYLHNPDGTQQRVLHRDIKSANILLDEDWNAKIADFGLSKLGPANQDNTFVYSTAVGTPGYIDPLYAKTGLLTKESDVYSFGVVLFEVLCGTLCFKHQDFVKLVQKSYDEQTINEIVYGSLKDEINPKSLYVFTTTAYQCLEREREKRPLMSDILEALKNALYCQGARNDQVEDDAEVEGEDGGWLVVTIHKGVNLDIRHSRVMMVVGTETKFTKAKYNNPNPAWEESFRFNIEKPVGGELLLVVTSASHMDIKVLDTDFFCDVGISIADVVKVKHMRNTYPFGNGTMDVELRFLEYRNPFANIYFPPEDRTKVEGVASKSEDGGWLVVTIHKGVNLGVTHSRVSLTLGTKTKFTKAKCNDENDAWEESFHFTLTKPAEEELSLLVLSGQEMYHISNFDKQIMGGIDISLADVVNEKHMEITFQIGNGNISVGLQFIDAHQGARNNPFAKNYIPPEDHAKAVGTTSRSEDAGFLVVKIHEGVNLEVKHPFVFINVGDDTQQTTIKLKNHNPVWEESFVFALDKPAEAVLVLGVCSCSRTDRILGKVRNVGGVSGILSRFGLLGTVKINVADVVKEKHMNYIFQFGNGKLRVDLELRHDKM